MDNLNAAFEPVRAVWRKGNWPGVVETTSYGTPSLKFKGNLLVRLKEPGVIVVACDLEEKDELLQRYPGAYFNPPSYKSSPSILANLSELPPQELFFRLEAAWRSVASKRMIADYDKRRA